MPRTYAVPTLQRWYYLQLATADVSQPHSASCSPTPPVTTALGREDPRRGHGQGHQLWLRLVDRRPQPHHDRSGRCHHHGSARSGHEHEHRPGSRVVQLWWRRLDDHHRGRQQRRPGSVQRLRRRGVRGADRRGAEPERRGVQRRLGSPRVLLNIAFCERAATTAHAVELRRGGRVHREGGATVTRRAVLPRLSDPSLDGVDHQPRSPPRPSAAHGVRRDTHASDRGAHIDTLLIRGRLNRGDYCAI